LSRPGSLHSDGHRPTRVAKKMSGRPTSRSIRAAKTYHGITYRQGRVKVFEVVA
jgi:hypothetical protein